MVSDSGPARISQAITSAWFKVLDTGSTPPDGGFDVAGGDSLGFLRLIMMIEQDLDIAIPLDQVGMDMTQDQLAAAIAQVMRPACSDGAGVGEDKPRRPVVFMIPVAGGDGPGQARLRSGCADRLDVQCVDLPHWSVIMRPGYTFDSLCDALVAQIKARAGDAPILLAGYCFGGALAAIVARKLVDQGHRVDFLGLLDADVTWFRRPTPLREARPSCLELVRSLRWAWQKGRLAEHAAWHAAEFLEQRARFVLRWLARGDRFRLVPQALRFHLNLYLQMVLLPRTDRRGLIRLMSTSQLAHIPTSVFRATGHDYERPEDLGWSELFAPVEVRTIDGDHQGVFEPELIHGLIDGFVAAVADAPERSASRGQGTVRKPVATT